MTSVVDEFYDHLETDLDLNRMGSLLVRQMQEELLAQDDTKKGSSAGELAAAFVRAQRSPEDRRAYLMTALRLLEKDKKLALSRTQGDADGPLAKDLLLGYGLQLGCPGFVEGKAWNKARMVPALLERLGTDPDAPPPDARLVRVLHAELQETLLLRRAKDYIYNIKKERKNNREMRIFAAYLAEKYGTGDQAGGSVLAAAAARRRGGSGQGQLTEPQIQQAEVLFKALQKKEYSGVLIPIEIDPLTGAGLYFAGVDRVNAMTDVLMLKGPNDWCRIVGLYLQTLELRAPEGGDPDFDPVDLVTWSDIPAEFTELCSFETVHEGVKWLRRRIRVDAGEIFLNDDVLPPEGCPPFFLQYFPAAQGQATRAQEWAETAALGRQAFEEDLL